MSKLSFDTPATFTKSIVNLPQITDKEICDLGLATTNNTRVISSKILSSVLTSDTEAFGQKLNSLVGLSKTLDPKKMGKPNIFKRLFNYGSSVTDHLRSQYQTVEQRMLDLGKELDDMSKLREQRIQDLEVMYMENMQVYDNLQNDIAVGNTMLSQLDTERESYGTPTDTVAAENLARVQTKISLLTKRLDDFDRASKICIFAAPEIRMQQDHNRSLISSVRDIKATTIPAWQGVFSRYVLALETKKSAQLLNAVYDATDEAFRMQADLMVDNAVQVAQVQQRSIISVETLQHVQQQLISAVEKSQEIERKATQARKDAKPQLEKLTQDLFTKLTGTK